MSDLTVCRRVVRHQRINGVIALKIFNFISIALLNIIDFEFSDVHKCVRISLNYICLMYNISLHYSKIGK